jgi:pyruvate dehydrogenase E2 component (dihydrolipoyllysine-residue acetyltransferase)
MANLTEVRVPDLGDFKDVPVIDVLVKEGDTIEVDTPLVTLETEKATMDVPSSAAGRIAEMKVRKGGKVSQGTVIALVEAAEGAPAAAQRVPAATTRDVDVEETARQPSVVPEATVPRVPPAVAAEATSRPPREMLPAELADLSRAHASPSVRMFARELGVDLTRVSGSGKKGRITHADVKAFIKRVLTEGAPATGAGLPRIPPVDFARFGPVETRPLNRIQRISGPRLHASWVNIPHVTQFDEADITELEGARAQLKTKAIQEGIKLTPLAFIIKACVRALQEYPQFNASLDESGENLVLKKYVHMGFAADTPNGLMVPVIRDADRKDIYELARSLGELSAKARDGKLSAAEMQGGCFTVSSLGSIGGTAFTPIINAPEVAILGVSRSEYRPVYRDGSFVPRLMLPLSLSYDHRVIDGALAVRFTSFLARTLADVRTLVEAIP